VPEKPEVGEEERAVAREEPPAAAERALADGVEDDVVALAVVREVLSGVVDDAVGAERSHRSMLLVPQTAVIRAPKCLASCTAAVPIDPEAPFTGIFCPR
jgi:hypothetical protein